MTTAVLTPMTSVASDTAHFNNTTGDMLLEESSIGEEKEKESPAMEFSNNGNHEEASESVLDEDLMAILADAAAKSPGNNSLAPKDEIAMGDPSAIPFPLSDGNNQDEEDSDEKKRPAEESATKPAAKRVKKQAQPPVKRSTRARKLPTKLKPRPSSMTSSSSAMSAAAILMGVASTPGENNTIATTAATTATKKKRASKKKGSPSAPKREGKVGGTSENLRGITMKRPGKWQAQFYYSGQSRYIGIFTSQEKAAEAYEIVRKTLKSDVQLEAPTPKEAFEIARKRAYEAVGEVLPEHPAPPPPQTNNVPSVGV